MPEKTSAALVLVLNELMDSDDEKPTRGITRELKVEDRLGFREMFRMDVGDFEFILGKISHLISPRQMSNFGGHLPIMPDERLALTLRYMAAGESFQSQSFRISLNAVSYIIKGCCNA